jgi:hypothetical protein
MYIVSESGRIQRIYVSFRKQDSGPQSQRLCERLSAYFGNDRIVVCLDNTEVEAVEGILRSCSLFLAVIGQHWHADSNGRRYMDDSSDFVRRDVATCLSQAIPVLIALMNGASMPSDLPEALGGLLTYKIITLRDDYFVYDVDRLITKLEVQLSASLEEDQNTESVVRRFFGKYRRTDVRYLHADVLWLDTTLSITNRRLVFHSHVLMGDNLRFLHAGPQQPPVEIPLSDVADLAEAREMRNAVRVVTKSGSEHLFTPFSGMADTVGITCRDVIDTIQELLENIGV